MYKGMTGQVLANLEKIEKAIYSGEADKLVEPISKTVYGTDWVSKMLLFRRIYLLKKFQQKFAHLA